jgi:hypothetical protein
LIPLPGEPGQAERAKLVFVKLVGGKGGFCRLFDPNHRTATAGPSGMKKRQTRDG